MPHTPECLAFARLPHPFADMIEVDGPADIPDFANECDEAMFWSTHTLSDRFIALNEIDTPDWFQPARPRTSPAPSDSPDTRAPQSQAPHLRR